MSLELKNNLTPHEFTLAINYMAIKKKEISDTGKDELIGISFIDGDASSQSLDSILEALSNSAERLERSPHSVLIFTTADKINLCLLSLKIGSRSIPAKVVDWSEITESASRDKYIIEGYVSALTRTNPCALISLPEFPTSNDRGILLRTPSKAKLDRDAPIAPELRGRQFSVSTEYKFFNMVKRLYRDKDAVAIKPNNHLITGYSCAFARYVGDPAYPLIDLWMLTSCKSDVNGLESIPEGSSASIDCLSKETVRWIRHVCNGKIKREFARALHIRRTIKSPDSYGHIASQDTLKLDIKFLFLDGNNPALPMTLPKDMPEISLSWEEIFQGEKRDDCHAVGEVFQANNFLHVHQWKFLYGVEVENEYTIPLGEISDSLTQKILQYRTFPSEVPHGHIVRVDGIETYRRSHTARRFKTT